MKHEVLKKVTHIILSMHGDVFADVVYNTYLSTYAKLDVDRIHARLNAPMLEPLLNVLRSFFDVQTISNGSKYMVLPLPWSQAYANLSIVTDFEPFEIHVTLLSKERWSILPVPFDIDQLAMSSSQIYIRPCMRREVLHPVSNRMEYLAERVQMRRFSLCDPRAYPNASTQQTYFHTRKCYRRAYKAVQRGWVMDDIPLGDRSFVVAHWGIFKDWYNLLRGRSSAGRREHVVAHAECALCHEPFKHSDTVINLSCNHTFHCHCNDSKKEGGLFAWLMDQGKDTCPVCRESLLIKSDSPGTDSHSSVV